MSAPPPSGSWHEHGIRGFPPATPTEFHPAHSGPAARQAVTSRALTYIALAVALIAAGLAIAEWFRPSPLTPQAQPSTPVYTEQQIAEAKTRTRSAVEVVHKGVALQSGANKGDGVSPDPALAEAQAANARLSIIGGSWYLRDHLDPATPLPLADTVRHLSDITLDMGANYLAGSRDADPSQVGLLSDGDSAFAHARDLCK